MLGVAGWKPTQQPRLCLTSWQYEILISTNPTLPDWLTSETYCQDWGGHYRKYYLLRLEISTITFLSRIERPSRFNTLFRLTSDIFGCTWNTIIHWSKLLKMFEEIKCPYKEKWDFLIFQKKVMHLIVSDYTSLVTLWAFTPWLFCSLSYGLSSVVFGLINVHIMLGAKTFLWNTNNVDKLG